MITRLEIENFKAIKKLAIDLDPLTVLVGPNDSGKSTILQALDLLSKVATPATSDVRSSVPALRADQDEAIPIRLTASGFVRLDDEEESPYRYTITFAPPGNRPNSVDETLSLDDNVQYQVSGDRPHLFLPPRDELHEAIAADLAAYLAALSPHALRAPCRSEAALARDGSGLAALLLRLRTDVNEEPFAALVDDLRRMSKFVTSVGLDTQSQPGMVAARFAITPGRRGVSAHEVSTGVLLATGYLALLHGTSTRRFLIEEPENGVHPRALLLIVDTLRRFAQGGRQVVMTTHSPVLLNYIDPANIRIVTRTATEGVTVTPALDSKVFNEVRQKIDFGELWYTVGDESLVAH